VQMDEKLFKSFKERMLKQEIDGSDMELSWPSIKDLVHSEVESGRRQIGDKVAEFKVDLLEMVQRGLDALRADVRATVTSRALQKSQKALLKKASGARANRTRKPRMPRNLTANLDAFLSMLPVSPAAKQDIGKYVKQKVAVGKEAKLAGRIDVAGESAAQALQGMEKALAGKMSEKDLRGELFARLQDLTQSYLKNPTPVARRALMSLRRTVLKGLKKLRSNVTASEKHKLLNSTSKSRGLMDVVEQQQQKIRRLKNKIRVLRKQKPVVVTVPVADRPIGGVQHLQRLLAARPDVPVASAPLDALQAQAEAAVAAAERAASGQSDVSRIAANIEAANKDILKLTSEVTRRVQQDLKRPTFDAPFAQ